MLPEQLSHTEFFQIRTYETGQKKEATIPHLLKLMHEAAMQNVLQLKVSVWDLEPHQISWVLRRMQVKFHRLPALGEKIKISTNPAGFQKLFTFRDYRVWDEQDRPLAQSSSTWLLMNTQTRRMSPIPDFISNIPMPPSDQCLPRPSGKLPPFVQAQNEKTFVVNWFDLDFNGHLNNVHYLSWMLEPLPQEILRTAQIEFLDIIYRAEAVLNDVLTSEIQQIEKGIFLHRLVNEKQRELASALSRWQTIQL